MGEQKIFPLPVGVITIVGSNECDMFTLMKMRGVCRAFRDGLNDCVVLTTHTGYIYTLGKLLELVQLKFSDRWDILAAVAKKYNKPDCRYGSAEYSECFYYQGLFGLNFHWDKDEQQFRPTGYLSGLWEWHLGPKSKFPSCDKAQLCAKEEAWFAKSEELMLTMERDRMVNGLLSLACKSHCSHLATLWCNFVTTNIDHLLTRYGSTNWSHTMEYSGKTFKSKFPQDVPILKQVVASGCATITMRMHCLDPNYVSRRMQSLDIVEPITPISGYEFIVVLCKRNATAKS